MEEFSKQFQSVTDAIGNAAKNFMGKLDHFTFKMLIDNLKSDDVQVVVDTIEQLETEKRPLSVAPLYFVSQNHPSKFVRDRATVALNSLADPVRIEQMTKGKSIEEAVKALIQEYGHYKA